MTITQSPDAPLVVVCGATGTQGGSVIDALAESDRAYRLRGLTRDKTKEKAARLAARGVEMVQVDLVVPNEERVHAAFEGADVAFVRAVLVGAVTNFWEHTDKQRPLTAAQEIDEGQMLVRAAHAARVSLLVWSGLEDKTAMSAGKYTRVAHFDSKAAVTRYARTTGVPLAVVQAWHYAANYTGGRAPAREADGRYVLRLAADADGRMPVVDVGADYGLFVRAAIERPELGAGCELLSCGEMISLREMMAQLSEITGRDIRFEEMSDAAFLAASTLPPRLAEEIRQSQRSHDEFGYYGKKDVAPSMKYLARKPRTWAEFAKSQDWDAILK
ncbi:hypothetical protein HWV62_41866 [Athelia sp. TMB]|nr:hypothetical protein HWV62_41866 [Athelia sp. TMB]